MLTALWAGRFRLLPCSKARDVFARILSSPTHTVTGVALFTEYASRRFPRSDGILDFQTQSRGRQLLAPFRVQRRLAVPNLEGMCAAARRNRDAHLPAK